MQALDDGTELCAKYVLTTDNDVIFDVAWILHTGRNIVECCAVKRLHVFVVGAALVRFAGTAKGTFGVDLQPYEHRLRFVAASHFAQTVTLRVTHSIGVIDYAD